MQPLYSRTSISGTASSGKKQDFDKRDSLKQENAYKLEVSVRSDSFRTQNVQHLADIHCKRELYAWFPHPAYRDLTVISNVLGSIPVQPS
jgi:hypothetical protein